MPYCNAALKTEPEDAEAIIARFAIDNFRAQAAYPLTSGMWNIDAGENDVRAVHHDNNGIIRFFCRYQHDVQFTEAKISDFASKHSDFCEVI